ncbi:MAG: Oligoendopeptidase F, partial [uncultured Solirubrobacterales bacterium]
DHRRADPARRRRRRCRVGHRAARRRRGRGRSRAPARSRHGARSGLRRAPRGSGGRARRRRADRRHARPRRDPGAGGPRGLLREPVVLDQHPGPAARSDRPARAGARHRDPDGAAVLRSRVGRALRRARRGAAGDRRARLLPPLPEHPAPLPPPSAQPARGAGPGREAGDRGERVGAPLLRAGIRDRGRRPARGRRHRGRCRRRGLHRAPRPRRRAQPPDLPRPRGPAHHGRGGHRRPRPRPAHPRLPVQHPPPRQGGRRSPARLSLLDLQPQPLQRGERRVGPGAGRGRQGPLRAAAAVVSPQGRTARDRSDRRLRPHGSGGLRGRDHALARRPRARARGLRLLLAGARPPRPWLLRRAPDRRAAAAGQARRRLLRLHRALEPLVRNAQLDLKAPRRAHPRPRARPRRPRRPRGEPGDLPPAHPAHAGRDRVGLRRGDALRAAARADRLRGLAPRTAGRLDRGLDRHGVPPDRDEPVRGPRALGPTRGGRAAGRALRRAVARVAVRDARRLGRAHRGLRHLVVLHPPLHPHPGLRLRLRLRAAARAVGLRALPRGGRVVRAALPRDALGRRLALARGARADRRRRPGRPRLLGRGAGARRASARAGRGRRARGLRRRTARRL